ncbi:MAG TPA: hypothetical protein PKB07_18705 [Flavilitoribacter sp.]|nr:hypothetical protein [Flavilitoribacter sp.]
MHTISQKDNLRFQVIRGFQTGYLEPVAHFVCWKLKNDWDDYNELYHATKYFDGLLKNPNLWIDSHLIMHDDQIKGCLFLVGGAISGIEPKYPIEDEPTALSLKYFHILDKGRGLGRFWLNEVVMPYYAERGFKRIYVNSSHPQSFPFYLRFGEEICRYNKVSDIGGIPREGRSFLLKLE